MVGGQAASVTPCFRSERLTRFVSVPGRIKSRRADPRSGPVSSLLVVAFTVPMADSSRDESAEE
jgi:hypothetical protein